MKEYFDHKNSSYGLVSFPVKQRSNRVLYIYFWYKSMEEISITHNSEKFQAIRAEVTNIIAS